MKNELIMIAIAAACCAAASPARAQVPQMIYFQGKINSTTTGMPFTGTGYFQFALVDAGAATTYWSNDGAAGAGAFPATAVNIPVVNGVYSALLGSLGFGMAPIPAAVFEHSGVYLRIWFSDAGPTGPFTTLTPDIRIASVAYALVADTVSDGAVTETKVAAGAITETKLAAAAITASAIADGAVTSDKLERRAVTEEKLADDSVGGRALAPNGVSGNEVVDDLDLGDRSNAGKLEIWSGTFTTPEVVLDGATRTLSMNQDGTEGLWLGVDSSRGGKLELYQENGAEGVLVLADVSGNNSGGAIAVLKGSGGNGVYIDGDSAGSGKINVFGTDGRYAIELDGNDSTGKGRIKTEILEITGGADLSENFEVNSSNHVSDPEPGTVVCIDPANPGQLAISGKAYDRTVAGIVSGAGGVRPGMLMGQQGTPASGRHPVALTGRVYCKADASHGAIQPGDLLTTSDFPGHAMKVTDPNRAQGAIIGKAMSSLNDGTGLVLVLVSLQ